MEAQADSNDQEGHKYVCILGAKYGFGPSVDFPAQTLDPRFAQQIRVFLFIRLYYAGCPCLVLP